MNHPIILGGLTLILGGCSEVIVRQMNVDPVPGNCKGVEVRTSMLNTQGAIMCWDEDGRLAGMTGGPGAPQIEIPLTVIRAGATIGGAAILGGRISEMGKDIPSDFSLEVGPDPAILQGLQ